MVQTKEEGSISTENTGDGDKVVLRFSWWGGIELAKKIQEEKISIKIVFLSGSG